MDKIKALIEQALHWRYQHLTADPKRHTDAAAAALRAHALIDAYEAIGGNGADYRKQCGVLK